MLWVYVFLGLSFVYNAAYAAHCIRTRQIPAAVGAITLFAVSAAVFFLV